MVGRPKARQALLLAPLILGFLFLVDRPRDSGWPVIPGAAAAGTVTWEYKNATIASWSEGDLYDSGPTLRQLADTGANSVTFVVTWYTTSQYSTDIYRTGGTASDAALVWAIGQGTVAGANGAAQAAP
jgi:hypothetical protein